MSAKTLFHSLYDMLVLLLLKNQEMYGYRILYLLKSSARVPLTMNAGTIYPILSRLHRKGWVAGRWEDVNRRRRHIYKLTPKGAEHLQRQVDLWKKVAYCFDDLIREEGLSK